MSKLRFHPGPGALLTHPTMMRMTGSPATYMGRHFVPDRRAYAADAKAFEVDPAHPIGRRCRKVAIRDYSEKQPALWPADAATAAALGLPFVEVAQDSDGEWVPKPPASKPPPAKTPKPKPKRAQE